MNRWIDAAGSGFGTVYEVTRAMSVDVSRHWVMAGFSLVAGFGVWFAIQDVENPRVSETVSFAQGEGVVVEARNVPEGYIFEGATISQIRIQARDRDIPDLTGDDFEAWVDLGKFDPTRLAEVEVNVRSRKDGVRAVEAVPAVLRVGLVVAVSKDFPVSPNFTGALPEGYELLSSDTDIEPAFVLVTGTQVQIDSISRVQIDVDLSGRRDETSTFEGDLVARTAAGNDVTAQIEPARAKVTLKIQQTSSQRTISVLANIAGHPAAGYSVGAVTYDPVAVTVTGLKTVLDELSTINLEPVDVGGATTNVQVTRTIRIPNTFVQPTTVKVTVEINRDECNVAVTPAGCSSTTLVVAVSLGAPPAGLMFDTGNYFTIVRVTGAAAALQALTPGDIQTSVPGLATASAGTGRYDVVATGPAGIRIDSADPVMVTLRPATIVP